MKDTDLSDVHITLKGSGETLVFSDPEWQGVCKPFETIKLKCTLPLDAIAKCLTLGSSEIESYVYDVGSGMRVPVQSTNIGLFMGPVGFVDTIGNETMSGWAWDPRADGPIMISIESVNRIQSVLANRYRNDLDQLGLGSGLHGFTCRLDPSVARSEIKLLYKGAVIAGIPAAAQ